MEPDETEAVVAWCLAACRESDTPRATFDDLMDIVTSSGQCTSNDLDSIRRNFIRRILAAPGNQDSAVHRATRGVHGDDFLASRRVASYFQPCLDRCRRSDRPFETLTRALAALSRAPDWTEDDLHELRMRITKALLDEELGRNAEPDSEC